MDQELKRRCFEKIEDYLLDEKNIVTYKLLCQEMNIHVNTAKQLLAEYLSKMPPIVQQEYSVTYVIGGQLRTGHGLGYKLVKEADLSEARKRFAVVTTEHVHSIQLTNEADWGLLTLADGVHSNSELGYKSAIFYSKCKRIPYPMREERLLPEEKSSSAEPPLKPANADTVKANSANEVSAAKRRKLDTALGPGPGPGPSKGKGPAKGMAPPKKGSQKQTSLTAFFHKA